MVIEGNVEEEYMDDEVHDPGLLAAESSPRGPGGDPLEAVLAVAEPRAQASGLREAETDSGAPGVLVETKVNLGAPDAGTQTGWKQGQERRGNDSHDTGVAEDSYGEFAWPDGYVADPQAVAKFVPLAKELGLSKNSAQSLAKFYAELDQERNRAQAEFIAKNNTEWLHEIQRHPEFGGPRLARTGEDVASMMRRYGSPLLTAQIRQMNVQNWPEMFYFLARVAKAIGEDCSPAGEPGAIPPKSTAHLLFPGLK